MARANQQDIAALRKLHEACIDVGSALNALSDSAFDGLLVEVDNVDFGPFLEGPDAFDFIQSAITELEAE